MQACTADAAFQPSCYELRFDSLFVAGRGLAFPCDAAGCTGAAGWTGGAATG